MGLHQILEQIELILKITFSSQLMFTQFSFWGVLLFAMLGVALIGKRIHVRNTYLLFLSLLLYYNTSQLFFLILVFSTFIDFYIGKKVYQAKSEAKKKMLITLSLIVNLGMLAYFKYAYFFTESYNSLFNTDYKVFNHLAYWANAATGTHYQVDKILLPVGISFFTFQTISYSIDIYRGKIKPVKNILDFGFYVSFFPQLVAGPIVRASDFIPQIYNQFKLTKQEFGLALFWILNGLTKKIVIGDYLAVNFIDRVFQNPALYTGFEALFALFAYSLQVYCDFSGYTDIAIGVALIMGFRLPANFNSPYKAMNVGEFWKRWHISLSSWLKDYLYIPMGGNKSASVFSYIGILLILGLLMGSATWMGIWTSFTLISVIIISFFLSFFYTNIKAEFFVCLNLLLTMLLGGLWHGASWQFVIWGGLNGVALLVYKFWKRVSPLKNHQNNRAVRVYSILITFTFITFTRIWFRAESMEIVDAIISKIRTEFNASLIPQIITSYWNIFLVFAVGMIIHWLSADFKEKYRNFFANLPLFAQGIITVFVVFFIYQFMSSDLQAFIYFQF